MSNIIKDDLLTLKNKLEAIEDEFEAKLVEVEKKGERFTTIDKTIKDKITTNDYIMTINIGGRVFQTRASTVLWVKDTIFYKMIVDDIENNRDWTSYFFFDRNYKYFPVIMDYFRTKKYSFKGYNKNELNDLNSEMEYYGIHQMIARLEDLRKEIEFVSFESSGRYSTAGTHKVEDLKDKTGNKGICVQSPYWIIIELNFEHEFEKLEIMGWRGNSSLWGSSNGSGAKILTSLDKTNWKQVGTIPSNFANSIATVNLTKSTAKYIKFQHTGYLGIGYLNIIRSE